tara:strand:+ start:2289 stop:2723 length:435 start_codon:yes stop_codon:yes gene_type:complete
MTTAWSILDKIAETKVEDCRVNVEAANQKLNKIAAQKIQLIEMLEDYQKRLKETQEIKHSIDENISYRHFIKQVQELLEVISKDEAQAELSLRKEEDLLIEALKEKKKAEFLIEREELKIEKRSTEIEQKNFDEVAIHRFNHQT